MTLSLASQKPWLTASSAFLLGASLAQGQSAPVNPPTAKAAVNPTYTPHLAFDVASIHQAKDEDMSVIDNMPGSSVYFAHNLDAWTLVFAAYEVPIMGLLTGGPPWTRTIRYNVQAQSDADADALLARLNQQDFQAEKRHMLQGLLAERFHLQIHSETRVSTTYELVATQRTKEQMVAFRGDLGDTISSCTPNFSRKGEEMASKGCPFSFLTQHLQDELGTKILDRTGMSGVYAYHLAFMPENSVLPPEEQQYPGLMNALRDQLGLELKRTKGPVTFWVIDHIEQPTPN